MGIRGGWAAGAAVAVLLAYAHIAGGGAVGDARHADGGDLLSLRIIDQRTAPRHAMAITVAVILLASPLAIADVGLWLTFGATAAIVAGATRVRDAAIALAQAAGRVAAGVGVRRDRPDARLPRSCFNASRLPDWS